MKLLFDENLSYKLVEELADLFPDSSHVRILGLASADDPEVWEAAVANGFVIVSKDSDMHDRSLLFGYPPKVIWIRLGNCSTRMVEQLIRQKVSTIEEFVKDEVASFLTLS